MNPSISSPVSTNGASTASTNRRPRTRGELEAAISRAFIQMEKECTGRGPLETRTFLIEDLVLVRLRGVLTPAEIKLASAEHRGAYLIKQTRLELTNVKRPQLEALVAELLGVKLRSLHTDISTRTGERVIVMSLDRRPELSND
ncbi:MAG: DUF2294 domain-containing protein [Gemmataceae bacterium]|nr:DUF2294 domain-containing protein [Gemmataceae bacterium]